MVMLAVFQRLAQRFQGAAGKFWKLIQKQHAMVGQRNGPRPGGSPATSATALAVWCGAPAGRRPHSCGSKRPARLATAALSSASCSVMAGSRLLKALGQHGFAGPRRPHQQQAVPASGGNLQGAFGLHLALHIGQIGAAGAVDGGLRGDALPAFAAGLAQQMRHHIEQTRRTKHLGGGGQSGFAGTVQGQNQALIAAVQAADQAAAHRAQGTGEGQLPGKLPAVQSLQRNLPAGGAKIPSAIGRLKRPESLGKSAGAKLTVMRLLLETPARCFAKRSARRSRASFTSTSASPTKLRLGRPLARCTSTVTAGAASPSRARL